MTRNVSLANLGPAAQAQVVAQIGAQEKQRASKYGNHACVVDGLRFDSKKEANRYVELHNEEKHRRIEGLRCQPAFRIEVRGQLICDYVADFEYMRAGVRVVEDVKSVATRTGIYKIKKKLLKAVHGIDVVEV